MDSEVALLNQQSDMHLIDGTSSSKSYLVFARKGEIMLGVKFYGIQPGEAFKQTNKSYMFVRVRSARDAQLAQQLDLINGYNDQAQQNVVSLADTQLTLDNAWPDYEFEKIDDERASLAVGLFIRGSIASAPQVVAQRIEEGDFFRDLANYIMEKAGPEHCILPARTIAKWLEEKAQSTIKMLKAAKATQEALEEFENHAEDQIEVVGPHTALLKKMHDKHLKQAGLIEDANPVPTAGALVDPSEDPEGDPDEGGHEDGHEHGDEE